MRKPRQKKITPGPYTENSRIFKPYLLTILAVHKLKRSPAHLLNLKLKEQISEQCTKQQDLQKDETIATSLKTLHMVNQRRNKNVFANRHTRKGGSSEMSHNLIKDAIVVKQLDSMSDSQPTNPSLSEIKKDRKTKKIFLRLHFFPFFPSLETTKQFDRSLLRQIELMFVWNMLL